MLNHNDLQYISQNISFWNKLTESEQKDLASYSYVMKYPKGKSIYRSNSECLGLVLVEEGQLRAYITSNDGKEITLYRLLSLDMCILSASCMIKNLNFDINIEVEKDCKVYIIPSSFFNNLNEKNLLVKNFTLELVSARFSEVMWVFDQYVFGSAAKRLANFLINQSNLEGTNTLNFTHEFIANDLGTAREVITRLLKHFSTDGLVTLNRGNITIENRDELEKLC